jgi:hypothetical protein
MCSKMDLFLESLFEDFPVDCSREKPETLDHFDVPFYKFADNEWKQIGAQRGATGGARSHLGGIT